MSVETLEKNGTQVQETDKGTEVDKMQAQNENDIAGTDKERQVVALSVQDESAKARQPVKLSVQETSRLPQNRPIEPSHLKVVSTYSSVGGNRPVTSGDIQISSTLTVSGHRPIALSTLQVSETYSVMGNRPVASNEIDDAATLMGYID